MLYEIKCKVGDALRIVITNDKKEYSSYYIKKITKEQLEGDDLNFFLEETTGFEL